MAKLPIDIAILLCDNVFKQGAHVRTKQASIWRNNGKRASPMGDLLR